MCCQDVRARSLAWPEADSALARAQIGWVSASASALVPAHTAGDDGADGGCREVYNVVWEPTGVSLAQQT